MHAYTIAFTLALAGSSMAAVIQSPPSTSTTTTTTDELRSYGPTCARSHGDDGPTCASVGPDAPTAVDYKKIEESLTEKERALAKEFDVNENGHLDEEDVAAMKAVVDILRLGDKKPEDDKSDNIQPPTVRVATTPPRDIQPSDFEHYDLEPETINPGPVYPFTLATIDRDAPTTLATTVAESTPTVVAAASPCPECPKCTEPKCPKCPKPECAHPRVYNPNWDKLELLNDTRKNAINGFKLFADFGNDMPVRFAIHAKEHKDRKDIWNIKMIASNFSSTPNEDGDFFPRQELASMNLHQPRWNLADNRLETRKNESTPIDDTLFLRLYDAKVKKDTTQLKGPVLRTMLTTNSNKNKYGKEGNAKLLGKKSWQLRRDPKEPFHYTLLNKDTKGGFFWCMTDAKAFAVLEKAISTMGQEDLEMSDVHDLHKLMGDNEGAELIYADSETHDENLTFSMNGVTESCVPITLKVR
jgi:hypothetical protein